MGINLAFGDVETSVLIGFILPCTFILWQSAVWRQYSRYEKRFKRKIHSLPSEEIFTTYSTNVRTPKDNHDGRMFVQGKARKYWYSHETKLEAFRSLASSGECGSTIRFNCIAFSLGPHKLEMGAVGSLLLSRQRVLPAASSS